MIRRVALLLTALAAPAVAADLVSFEQGIPGLVSGSTSGASWATCSRADVAPLADVPGSARVITAPAALGGGPALRLSTNPLGQGADALAQSRWELPFDVTAPSHLSGQIAFVTTDRADHGDWWIVLLDGHPLLCGDAARLEAAAIDVLSAGDRSSGWIPFPQETLSAGGHVLSVVVGDGIDSTGESSVIVSPVSVVNGVPGSPDCQPAPASFVNEVPTLLTHVATRWTFDDNRFCAAGSGDPQNPGLDCSRPGENPNPDGFVDSTGLSFEMYVVADCGQEMHVPLNDVESGCISVYDQTRFPIPIHVSNGVPPGDPLALNEDGGEVCWNAVLCDGGGANNPGGPGEDRIIDVTLQGAPTLCGVYILNFRSWAGCIWDLFANCDGSGNSGFNIFDDLCLAEDALNPLPEILLDDPVLSTGAGCFVDFCVTVRNVGCQTVTDGVIRVVPDSDVSRAQDYLVTLGPGADVRLCDRVDLPNHGPNENVSILITADPDDAIVECTESNAASACQPQGGRDAVFGSVLVPCELPPTCDAGGPYSASCGGGSVQLDGTRSRDPDGFPLTYAWSLGCAGAQLDDPASPTPVVTITGAACGPCQVTLIVTDVGGTSVSCTSSILLGDAVPPVVKCPADLALECPAPDVNARRAAWLAQASASDDCSEVVPVVPALVSSTPTCAGFAEVWEFRATDACDNRASCTSTFSIIDTHPPTVTPPADRTVECGSPEEAEFDAWAASGTATDACAGALPVSVQPYLQQQPCPLARTYTFRATDPCGNAAEARATWTVADTQPPTLVGVPASASVPCPMVPAAPPVTAHDACDPAPTVSFSEATQPGACPQEVVVTRTWTARDACHNESVATQVITLVDDVAPQLQGVPGDLALSCSDPVPPAPAVSAQDACDPNPSVTLSSVTTPGACPQEMTIVRTWTARDACLNQVAASQTITITDDGAPQLVGVPADLALDCSEPVPSPAAVSALDACDPNPSVTLSSVTTPGACPQEMTIVRTWTARDACLNEVAASQTITVTDDGAPQLVGVPADLALDCSEPVPSPAAVSALDACDPNPSVTLSSVTTPGNCPQELTIVRTWTARDACLNETSASQTISVTDDTAPVFVNPPADETVECPGPPPAPELQAIDACDPDPSVTFDELTEPLTNAAPINVYDPRHLTQHRLRQLAARPCPQEKLVTRTWVATDACGNSVTHVQHVSVVDTTPPVLSAPADVSVQCPAPASGPGSEAEWIASASAVDACGPATLTTREISRVPGCGNTYVLTVQFDAVDACGNAAAPLQRSYSVIDELPPTLVPPVDESVECPAPASGPGSEAAWIASASASDGCGDARVESLELERTPGCGATYLTRREFWAVDACGNESARVERRYDVVDTTPPLLASPADVTVECPAPASGLGSEADWLASVSASDTCGSARVETRLVSDQPGCGDTFTHVWELWAVDACGLESAREQRMYRVEDTTPPVFSQPDRQFRQSIWPPNHGYVVMSTADVVSAADACGAVTVRATGCHSSQPEEVHQGRTEDGGNGDGRTFEDCVISLDGTQFAVRAERLGSCGADSARYYAVEFTAVDECGNQAIGAGDVVVEHDRSNHQDVLRGHKLGPNDPPPFPYIHATTYGDGCGP